MSSPSQRLRAMGLELPEVAAPLAAYVPATRVGDQVWTSGQLPLVSGRLALTGKVGAEVDVEQAAGLARTCALNGLAAVAALTGGLDAVEQVLKVLVFVASDPSFTAQPAVGNGASELLGELFGQGHVRSAVGVAVLPRDAPVEVELVVAVRS